MKTSEQLKRSRRLRKKLYVDEFVVLGFEISFKFSDIDETTFDSFFSELVGLIESRSLIMGGAGGAHEFSVFISPSARYESSTEEDRCAFINWLAEHTYIKDAVVGELTDAYYGA